MSISTLNEALRNGIARESTGVEGAVGSNSLDEIMVDDLVNDTRAAGTTHLLVDFGGPTQSTCINCETVNCASDSPDGEPVRFAI